MRDCTWGSWRLTCGRWTRVADRRPFIEAPAPGAWDESDGHGFVRPATGLFVHGDEVRMYYSNTSGRDVFGGVGMATWRRDGFVSLRAGDEPGEVLTRTFVPTGSQLHLKIDASGVVHWSGSDFAQRVGKATTLRIELRNADLYSFWTLSP